MASSLSLLEAHLLTDVTSGQSVPVDVRQWDYLTIYVIGTGTIAGGTLIVEEAFFSPVFQQGANHGGWTTWSTIPVSGGSIALTGVSGGKQVAYQLPVGRYASIRVRIGTSVSGGGTVSAVLIG